VVADELEIVRVIGLYLLSLRRTNSGLGDSDRICLVGARVLYLERAADWSGRRRRLSGIPGSGRGGFGGVFPGCCAGTGLRHAVLRVMHQILRNAVTVDEHIAGQS